jgi:mannosyltransferase OCH1-like enzyme
MKRKDVVELMVRQFEEKKKVPKLKLTHEIIIDNLAIQFEVDNEFKIGKYTIYGNFSTFTLGAVSSALRRIERIREIINRFHRDEITIEEFNTLISALLQIEQPDNSVPAADQMMLPLDQPNTIPFKEPTNG